MLSRLFAKSWFRFVFSTIIAISVTIVSVSIMDIFYNSSTSVLFGVIVLIVSTYLLNIFFVYKGTFLGLVNLLRQFICLILIFVFDALLTLIVLGLLPDTFILLSLAISLITTSVINYFLFNYTFKTSVNITLKSWLGSINYKTVIKFLAIHLALSIPIVIFSIGLLQSGQKIIPGDPDYYFQLHEAFRRSILEFHQLPFWNGWVAGGIPLFANIQFGFISVQTPFILLFGTVFGAKLAIIAYLLIAFFGFRRLFIGSFKSSAVKSTLLAYIPVFGSFFVDRIVAGHFTFLLIAFVPWLLIFFLNYKKTYSWLFFALTYSLMVLSAPHYTTIMSMVVIGIWFAYLTIGNFIKARILNSYASFKSDLLSGIQFFLKAVATIFIICFYRMFFVADFIGDFPREIEKNTEGFTGLYNGLYAIWGPDQYNAPPLLNSGWGWAEAATYIGIGTLVCLIIIFFIFLYGAVKKHKSVFSYQPVLLGSLFVTFFVLGMGDFGPYSPYTLLSHLPVFDSMRVATRWLMWASLIVLFIIAAYKGATLSKTINLILLLTVIELFVSGSHALSNSYFLNVRNERGPSANFEQVFRYNLPRQDYLSNQNYVVNYSYDENLLEATQNNIGQVIAGDSLVDTRQPNSTIRCGVNQGNCPLISPNGRINYWSPNKIIIQRINEGPITLNMNPGKGWLVNGTYVFKDDKITDPLKTMILVDPAEVLTVEYAPKLSPLWLKTTLKQQL